MIWVKDLIRYWLLGEVGPNLVLGWFEGGGFWRFWGRGCFHFALVEVLFGKFVDLGDEQRRIVVGVEGVLESGKGFKFGIGSFHVGSIVP
jgi:hypothetical protein